MMNSTSSSTDLEGIGYALYSLGEHIVIAAWIVGVGLIFVFVGLIFFTVALALMTKGEKK